MRNFTKINLQKVKKQQTMKTIAVPIILFALAVVCSIGCAEAEPNLASSSVDGSSGGGGGDSSASADTQFAHQPKRQYFIAPRVGRSSASMLRPTGSMLQPATSSAIWSSLEEASLLAPGQVQASRGYPSPLRSSLLFLLGNRAHSIGPRSPAGLLPQARIGRRASPSGLLPQPRVGRRSNGDNFIVESEGDGGYESSGGQQEIAMNALSDTNAYSDAMETLING